MGLDDYKVPLDHNDFGDRIDWYKPMLPANSDTLQILSDGIFGFKFHGWIQRDDGGFGGSECIASFGKDCPGCEDGVKFTTKYIAIVWVHDSEDNDEAVGKILPWRFSYQTRDKLNDLKEKFADPFKTAIYVTNSAKSKDDAKLQNVSIREMPKATKEVTSEIKEELERVKEEVFQYFANKEPSDVRFGLYGGVDASEHTVQPEESATSEDSEIEGKIEALLAD